jgi:hypothetical protein
VGLLLVFGPLANATANSCMPGIQIIMHESLSRNKKNAPQAKNKNGQEIVL